MGPAEPPISSTVGLALAAGLAGIALNAWATWPLYPGLDLLAGSIPVLLAALAGGWRAGLPAALLAGAGSWLLRGYPLAWLIYAVEAVAVGGLRGRAHPGLVVLALWAMVGAPLFAVGVRAGGAFGASLQFTALKNPLQEFLTALVAHGLYGLPAVRRALATAFPGSAAHRPTLRAFHFTFVGLVIGVATLGSVGFQVRQIERGERAASVAATAAIADAVAAGAGAAAAAGADLAVVARRIAAAHPDREIGLELVGPGGAPAVVLAASPEALAAKPAFLPQLPPGKDVVAERAVGRTGWRVRATTPFWVLHQAVDRTLLAAAPAFLALLALLALLGAGLAAVLGRELGGVAAATERLGDIDAAAPAFPAGAFAETEQLLATYARVSASLRAAVAGLRARDTELTLVNDALATTVEELRALDRQRLDLVDALGHDIRIPLTSVMGYAEMLEDGTYGPLAPDQVETARRVLANARRVVDLLDDLLALARAETDRFPIEAEAFDVRPLLVETGADLRPLFEARGHHLAFDLPSDPLPVEADPRRVQQVVVNLLSNAAKYTGPGGHIRVEVRRAEAPAAPGAVRIAVVDDGPGIAPADLPHVFERFYRARGVAAPGSGLGLAICRQLVEGMGGRIGIDSAIGRGTTVWFTLRPAPPSP